LGVRIERRGSPVQRHEAVGDRQRERSDCVGCAVCVEIRLSQAERDGRAVLLRLRRRIRATGRLAVYDDGDALRSESQEDVIRRVGQDVFGQRHHRERVVRDAGLRR